MLAIDFFDQAVVHFPNRIAVTDGSLSFTYSEIDAIASDVANSLSSCGLKAGAHVAILSPNHPLVLACQYGILRAGCVWVPANYRNPPQDTVVQFAKLDVDWLFYHSSMQSYLDGIAAEVDQLTGLVPIDAPSGGRVSLADWCATFTSGASLPKRTMDDVMYVGSTGGTSGGGLKGVVHTNRSWEINIANYYAIHNFEKPPVHLVVAPLTHAAGVFHWGLVGKGATHVLCPSADPATILAMVERYCVTIIFLPPTIIYMLLAYPDLTKHDLSSLEYIAFGAAPMSVQKLKEAIAIFGPVLYQAYGSTETLIMNTCMTREDMAAASSTPELAHRLASAGREGPFSRVAIMSEDGRLLPAGERGEIVIRSGSIMREYYKDVEKSVQSRLFGWHHTGDVGLKDEDGFIYIVDRKNDMIISGGFNIYPSEIEQVILSHTAIQDCAVVGVPHEKWGEMVVAAVELKQNAVLDEAEFLSFCKTRLGSVKAPKAVEVLAEMPRSPVGKTLRRAVRERHWAGRLRQI